MKTKTVKFISREKIDAMLANGELVVTRKIPGVGDMVGKPESGEICGLIMGAMADELLGKELKLVFSRTYGCWRTGMWAVPNWLVDMSEEVSVGTDN